MSERGSFVTEYIYCDHCFEAAKAALLQSNNELCATVVPSWEGEGQTLPIIAGKVGASYAHGEPNVIANLKMQLCHPLRIAIIPEAGPPVMILKLPDQTQPTRSLADEWRPQTHCKPH